MISSLQGPRSSDWGPVLLEFGASWCGHCQALAPKLARFLEDYAEVHHVKIEDGPGKRLGRSFGVKLWPTLVFLKDGKVVKQAARPAVGEVQEGLTLLVGGD
jgi:thioredoxin 1